MKINLRVLLTLNGFYNHFFIIKTRRMKSGYSKLRVFVTLGFRFALLLGAATQSSVVMEFRTSGKEGFKPIWI